MTREIIIESGATGAITGSVTAQFSYTDSTWKDLLTSCGNMSFTYAEAMIGVFPNEGFTAKASVGAGLFGAGFVFRVKPAQ